MHIEFRIGDIRATLHRHWFSGGMTLVAAGRSIRLQHPLHPGTHVSWRRERHWDVQVEGHAVRVEKVRPLLMAGIRAQTYRVFVDGQQVAGARGR